MSGSLIDEHRHWHRFRWQLFWGVIAAGLPLLARLVMFGSDGRGSSWPILITAAWSGLAAILLGILLIRNVSRYPGVERASAIIPSFSTSFGVLIVVLLMLRLDYSRWMFGGAYITAVVIFSVSYAQIFGRATFADRHSRGRP